jgi:hypothetical protein
MEQVTMKYSTEWFSRILSYPDDLAGSFARRAVLNGIAQAELSADGVSGWEWSAEVTRRVAQMQYALSVYVAGWI